MVIFSAVSQEILLILKWDIGHIYYVPMITSGAFPRHFISRFINDVQVTRVWSTFVEDSMWVIESVGDSNFFLNFSLLFLIWFFPRRSDMSRSALLPECGMYSIPVFTRFWNIWSDFIPPALSCIFQWNYRFSIDLNPSKIQRDP